MLTKMPRIGDVIVANENVVKEISCMTVGKEYEIFAIDSDGDAEFEDDIGDITHVSEGVFYCFENRGENGINTFYVVVLHKESDSFSTIIYKTYNGVLGYDDFLNIEDIHAKFTDGIREVTTQIISYQPIFLTNEEETK